MTCTITELSIPSDQQGILLSKIQLLTKDLPPCELSMAVSTGNFDLIQCVTMSTIIECMNYIGGGSSEDFVNAQMVKDSSIYLATKIKCAAEKAGALLSNFEKPINLSFLAQSYNTQMTAGITHEMDHHSTLLNARKLDL